MPIEPPVPTEDGPVEQPTVPAVPIELAVPALEPPATSLSVVSEMAWLGSTGMTR